MNKKSRAFLNIIVAIIVVTGFIGCAPKTFKAHPDLETRIKNINNPGLIPPDIKIYELTAGGMTELRDDWCETGKQHTINAITEKMNDSNDSLALCEVDENIEDEVEDMLALYRAVSTSILYHTYQGPNTFPEKQKNFDYSVGSIENILHKVGTDSLVMVYGLDQISTGGRKALMFVASIAGVTIPAGITVLNVALVDSSGQVLWYDVKAGAGNYDLRDAASVENIVKKLFSDFPDLGK